MGRDHSGGVTLKLRQYQRDCCNAVFKAWQKHDRVAAVLATGTGKTIIACNLIDYYVKQGQRCLFLCHRDELIRQAVDKLSQATGLMAAVEKAGESAEDSMTKVTVGSVQTLMRQKRLDRFDASHYDKIIVDEAHGILADSFQRVLSHFEGSKVLGITATFMRGDKRELGSFFESIAYEYGLRQAIADGWLCKIRAQTVPLDIDLTKVKKQCGDFKESDLADSIEPYLDEIAKAIKRLVPDKKILIFTPLIRTSLLMVEHLVNQGMSARHIDGKSPDRRELLQAYANDEFRVLSNAMLLTHGYDEPSIDCVIVLRPTQSSGLYIQMVGRGTRLCEGKEDLTILDFLWHTAQHKLSHPASLVSGNEEEAERVTEKVNASGGSEDIEDVLDEVKNEITNERESALAKNIDANKRRKARTIDPTQFGICTLSDNLVDYEAVFGWQKKEASDQQKGYLDKLGFDSGGITAGYASAIIDEVNQRREAGLATPKQVAVLMKNGYANAGKFKFEQASETITWLAEHRWGKKGKKR